VVSRNVANAGNDLATRKVVHSITGPGGANVRLSGIERVSDQALFENAISSNSTAARYKAITESLDQLNQTINDVEQDFSPAALLTKLDESLQQFATVPNDPLRAQSAISAAADMANGLNSATNVVQQARTAADKQIADSVANLNDLLAQFQQVNKGIVTGAQTGADVTDLLDTRDKLLSDISGEIGIRTVTRENNDIAIYTDSGVTMFETQARQVSFDPKLVLTAGDIGNAVFVDGVSVAGNSAALPTSSGRIKGLTEIRDDIAVTYQNQLDEIARGLITAFSESDQSATPSLPDATGLFTYPGSPAVPAAGTLVPGLAGQIRVNAAVDPAQGGNPFLLRDGGVNGPAYVYNSTGAAGFSTRLLQLGDNLHAATAFDPSAQAGVSATPLDFAANSVGWLQETRQSADAEFQFRNTVYERSVDSLTKTTSVNLDYEMTLLLDLEHSYQATSRLISTVDNMYESLLAAAG
jgi:flagellar hook-associated protein 1 FlgK